MKPRSFWLILLLIALIGLAVRVIVGLKTFISFDEWQHVFMASSARWADLAFELRTNAHPPLFFLLLRPIVRFGGVGMYRAISIAAGTGSIVIVGLIARKILQSPILPLVCAVAFALSTDAISISVEIRSYQLMTFFVLLAFWSWLEMLPETDGRVDVRHCITFAIFSSLAVLTHYSAAFFLGASVSVSVLLAVLSRQFRGMPRKSAWLTVSALAFPCVVFAIEYVVHAGVQPTQGYLSDFYRSGRQDESVVSFILRNAGNFLNLFSPIEFGTTLSLVVIFLLGVAAIFVLRGRSRDRTAAILFPTIIVLELLATSLANKYPFGGMLRHQYIAGPFLLIAMFAVLDSLIPLTRTFPKYSIPALLLTASCANLIAEGPKLIWYPGVVLLKEEFDAWKTTFPDARAVYVEHWGVIAHFIHTSDQPRHFVRRIGDDAVIDEFHLPSGTEIFYDKTRILLDFSDPSVYRSFAACLRGSGVKELSLFFFSPGDRPLGQAPATMENTIAQKAAEQGLVTTTVIVTRTTVFAGFRLK